MLSVEHHRRIGSSGWTRTSTSAVNGRACYFVTTEERNGCPQRYRASVSWFRAKRPTIERGGIKWWRARDSNSELRAPKARGLPLP